MPTTQTVSETFDTAGEYTYDIPAEAESVWVELEGAGGGNGNANGGAGGYAEGNIPVSVAAGATLTIRVGGGGDDGEVSDGGYNGGGNTGGYYGSGTGGGASDIRIGGTTLDDRVAVAAGGGGTGGSDSAYVDDNHGGDGGGLQGQDGYDTGAGGGGTQTAGGAGSGDGEDGSFGVGGDGGTGTVYGGAGGGGWYGGGGADSDGSGAASGGGGGGSSYIDDLTNATTTTGGGAAPEGDGSVYVEYDITVEAPTDLAVTGERNTELDLSWTEVDTEVDGYRLYRSTTSPVDPATDTLVVDLAQGTQSYTDTGLDHGTDYYYLLEAYQSDGSGGEVTETSNEANGTTTIPDVTGFVLDGSVQGELLAQEFDAGLNTGQYRIRWKRSVNSTYDPADEATVPFDADPLEYNIMGVLDGEQYDVGIRTETTDVTGTWHQANEITKLHAASSLTATSVGKHSVGLGWTVESDFDGSQQLWRRREDGKRDRVYDDPDDGELLATLDTVTESYTDDSAGLYPEREYTYTVREQTQYVYADATLTTETESAGLAQSAAPPRGWHVELDHPSGQTLTPQILDGARLEPRVNDLPRARIPIPRDDAYALQSYEGAPMRVYRDGARQPIDELRDVVIEPGRAALVGVGGTQLERRIQRDVDQEAAHTLASDLIATETSYAAVVDAPDVDEVLDEPLQTASTGTEFEEFFSPKATEPVVFRDGGLEPARTSFLKDIEYYIVGGASALSDPIYSMGECYTFDTSGDGLESTSFSVEYTIPADAVGISARVGCDTGSPAYFRVHVVDDSSGTSLGKATFADIGYGSSPGWFGDSTDLTSSGFTPWDGGDIPPGEYRIEVDCYWDGDLVYFDAASLHDMRYYDSTDFDENGELTDGKALDRPADYKPVTVESDDAQTVYSVTTGYLDTTWDDTSGAQAIALSNDNGRSWTEVENATSLTTSFDVLGADLRARLSFDGYEPDGVRSQSPRYGYAPQRVESYELSFDGDDTPLVVNASWDTDLLDVLVEIAEQSDSLFEVRYSDANGGIEIHWAQAGQRASAEALSLANYSVTKRGDRTLRATVLGGGRSETETISADLGTPISLAHTNLIPGTETVRDADTGERFEYLQDYTLQNTTGTIELLADGSITDGQPLEVSYNYKVSGTYEADAYDGDPRYDRTATISGITTERGCELAAKLIVDTTSEPRWEADVEIPASAALDGLLEALDLEAVPGEAMSVYDLTVSPERLSLRLGSRERVRETIEQIRSTVETASERV
ncbi:glycine-rich protein [Salinilacihabitans rarus]|uniref:glycine-rich protein n=1 Tax=Salinilacihabitans rarus TaxID=2961596 RepID=UPI0020C89F0C|nr:fibronectin type III domain-containing protein [Salinilacihabitans rarus]